MHNAYNDIMINNIFKRIYDTYNNVLYLKRGGGGVISTLNNKLNEYDDTQTIKKLEEQINKLKDIKKNIDDTNNDYKGQNNFINKSLELLDSTIKQTAFGYEFSPKHEYINLPIKKDDTNTKKIFDELSNTVNEFIKNNSENMDKNAKNYELMNTELQKNIKQIMDKIQTNITEINDKIKEYKKVIQEFELLFLFDETKTKNSLFFTITNDDLKTKIQKCDNNLYEKVKDLKTKQFVDTYNTYMFYNYDTSIHKNLPKKQYNLNKVYIVENDIYVNTNVSNNIIDKFSNIPTETKKEQIIKKGGNIVLKFSNLNKIMNEFRLVCENYERVKKEMNICNIHKSVYDAYLVIIATNKIFGTKYVLYNYMGKSEVSFYYKILAKMNKEIHDKTIVDDEIVKHLRKYHYVPIRMLYEFTKVLTEKIMTQNDVIDINECSNEPLTCFTLLNYFKSVVEAYNENKMSNITIYARINDIASADECRFDINKKLFISAQEKSLLIAPECNKKHKEGEIMKNYSYTKKVFIKREFDESKSTKCTFDVEECKKNNIEPNNSSALYLQLNKESCKCANDEQKTEKDDKPIIFTEVFDSTTFTDNASFVTYMSVNTQIAKGKGVGILTYGYSGTGKTYTLFGNTQVNGVLQSIIKTINGMDKLELRVFELYGLGVAYPHYWTDDKGDTRENDVSNTVYAYNLNTNDDKLGLNDIKTQIYIKGDISKYISDVQDINNKNSTYENLSEGKTSEQLDKLMGTFEGLVNAIEKERRDKKRIERTPNNPDSSRSIIVFDFRITVIDSLNNKKTVSFLIIDLPGREEIIESYVDTYIHEDQDKGNKTVKELLGYNEKTMGELAKTKFILSSICLNPMSVPLFYDAFYEKFTDMNTDVGKKIQNIKEQYVKMSFILSGKNETLVNVTLPNFIKKKVKEKKYVSFMAKSIEENTTKQNTCIKCYEINNDSCLYALYITNDDIDETTIAKKVSYYVNENDKKIIKPKNDTYNIKTIKEFLSKNKKIQITDPSHYETGTISTLIEDMKIYFEKEKYECYISSEFKFEEEFIDINGSDVKTANINTNKKELGINLINRLILTNNYDVLDECFKIMIEELINKKIKNKIYKANIDDLNKYETDLMESKFKGGLYDALKGADIKKGGANPQQTQQKQTQQKQTQQKQQKQQKQTQQKQTQQKQTQQKQTQPEQDPEQTIPNDSYTQMRENIIKTCSYEYTQTPYTGIYINENIMGLLSYLGRAELLKCDEKDEYKVGQQPKELNFQTWQKITKLWMTDQKHEHLENEYNIKAPYILSETPNASLIQDQIKQKINTYKSDLMFCKTPLIEKILKPYIVVSNDTKYTPIKDFKIFYLLANYSDGHVQKELKCKQQLKLLKGTSGFINAINKA